MEKETEDYYNGCSLRINEHDDFYNCHRNYSVIDKIVYSEKNPHPKWEEGWHSKTNKYPPITDFNNFECIEETTVWDKCEYNVPSHTYVLNGAGQCCGYFIRNDMSKWVEFGRPCSFSKSRRKFKKVKIGYIPISLNKFESAGSNIV